MSGLKKNIILTGLPGVGKTTLVKKVINKLQELKIDVNGFYTVELRENNYRIGFDIINCSGEKAPLARKGGESKFKVGTYNVLLKEFETIALPVFSQSSSVLIIDEIGKMELFSKQFEEAVRKVFKGENVRIIATVPLKASGGVIGEIKNNPNNKLITVEKRNRDKLLDEIISLLIN